MTFLSKQNILFWSKTATLALFLGLGVGMVYGNMPWTAPTEHAPNCVAGTPGCTAPIHPGGGDAQTKTGSLILGSGVSPLSEKMTLFIPKGSVSIGAGVATKKVDVAGFAKGREGLCIQDDCRDIWPNLNGNVYIDVPVGAVMPFNSGSCPSGGWIPFEPAQGRIVFGHGGGLSSFGGNEKIVQTPAQLASHNHPIYAPSYGFVVSVNQMGKKNCDSQTSGCNQNPSGYSGKNDGNINAGFIYTTGAPAPMDIMNPYLTLLYCKKVN